MTEDGGQRFDVQPVFQCFRNSYFQLISSCRSKCGQSAFKLLKPFAVAEVVICFLCKRFVSFTDAKKFTRFLAVFFKKFVLIQLFNA